MFAENHHPSGWRREGGPLDIIAIAVAIVVIVGGLFIFHSTSREFTTTSLKAPPLATTPPAMNPTMIPRPDSAPTQ
jgi:hypothetical protein